MELNLSTIDFSKAPYYDRFNANQQRTQVLFNIDRQLGGGELNELQSQLHYAIKGVGDSVMTDGDRQSGMGFTQDGNVITVEDGAVYLAGMRRSFTSQSVTITGVGMETIGVKLDQKIITADDDPTLLNNASGTPAFQSLGADRLEETVTLVANDSSSAKVYDFRNGILVNNTPSTELTKVQDMIATTSFDTNGSFRSGTNGFALHTEQNADNSDKLDIVVDSGIAYVKGYPIRKKYATRLTVDKSLTTATEQSEGSYYKKGVLVYPLTFPNVKDVTVVTGSVRKTATVTRGATVGGTDTLADNNIQTIEKVFTEGSTQITYEEDINYTYDHNSITWKEAGSYPTAGTSYRVTYVYTKVLVVGTDYKIVKGKGDNAVASIDFTGSAIISAAGDATGGVLVEKGLIQATYTYYLFRKDLVTLAQDGNFTVHIGQPNNLADVHAPSLVDPDVLEIGYVSIYPNSVNSDANVYVTTSLTMSDLGRLKQRVTNIEYNEAINMLDKAAYTAVDATALRGVFSDGFISLDKADAMNKEFTTAMSFDDASLTLPYESQDDITPKLDLSASNMNLTGNLITAPFTEQAVISQLQATSTINVNPYDQVHEGKLTLSPASDNWIDTENVTVTEIKYKSIYLDRWWFHGGWINSDDAAWYVKNAQWNTNGATNATTNVSGGWEKFQNQQNNDIDNLQGVTISAGGQRTIDTMEQFIRVRDVSFTVHDMTPNSLHYYITFNGIRCPIVSGSGFKPADTNGQVQVDASGNFQGSFTLPAGVECGIREVVFTNDTDSSEAPYQAQGNKRTIEDIIFKTYVTSHFTDPLAQSFVPTNDYNMTSIDLFFASKSKTENVTIQIRGMDSGFPNETIYGKQILTPDEVNVSTDASVATKISFDDMIRLKANNQYCVVILANDDLYTMWYAELGQVLVNGTGSLAQNAYAPGVMFTSSNAYTWSPQQTSDLMFKLYAATYNSSATIQFQPMDVKLDSLSLFSTYLTPNQTGATWFFRAITSANSNVTDITTLKYVPLANYELINFNGTITKLQLKATFEASMYSSPLLSLEDLSLGSFLHGLAGSYLGLNVDMTEAPYNTLSVSYAQFTPATATVVPRYSTDMGATWKTFTSNPVTKIAGNWTQVKYTETVATGGNTNNWAKQFKIRLDLKTANTYERPRVKALQCIMTQE